jgi:hypothetical protein
MPDARFRSLQRQAAQGDLQAQGRLLLERVRAGDLDPDGLRLAAYLGDPGAREALGADAPAAPPDLGDWAVGIAPSGAGARDPWTREALARVAAAAARAALPAWEEQHPNDRLPRRTVEAIEEWILCPCEDHAEAALHCSRSTREEEGTGWLERILEALPPREALLAVQRAARIPLSPAAMPSVVMCAARATSEETIRAAIREALLPWALGLGDPLRARVGRGPALP